MKPLISAGLAFLGLKWVGRATLYIYSMKPLLVLDLLFLECRCPWYHELKCLFFCPPLQKGKKRGRRPKGSGEPTSEGASEDKVILSEVLFSALPKPKQPPLTFK